MQQRSGLVDAPDEAEGDDATIFEGEGGGDGNLTGIYDLIGFPSSFVAAFGGGGPPEDTSAADFIPDLAEAAFGLDETGGGIPDAIGEQFTVPCVIVFLPRAVIGVEDVDFVGVATPEHQTFFEGLEGGGDFGGLCDGAHATFTHGAGEGAVDVDGSGENGFLTAGVEGAELEGGRIDVIRRERVGRSAAGGLFVENGFDGGRAVFGEQINFYPIHCPAGRPCEGDATGTFSRIRFNGERGDGDGRCGIRGGFRR